MSLRVSIEFASRPKTGEHHNGDTAVVRQEAGRVLFAVVDGLGHGEPAAQAADAARAHLAKAPISSGLAELLDGLNGALASTRGAAATICLFDGVTLSCLAVGNVALRSKSSKVGLGSLPGIVGRRLRRARPQSTAVSAGERVVLFSDGCSSAMSFDGTHSLDAGEACRVLLERFGRPSDDATVLIADFN